MKCWEKNAYDKKGAQTAMNDAHRRGLINISYYHCPECNNWHLTHEGKRMRDKHKNRSRAKLKPRY